MKLFCLVFLALSSLGTKGVKEESITWPKIWAVLTVGFVLFFLNWWLLALPISYDELANYLSSFMRPLHGIPKVYRGVVVFYVADI